jgi:hypothetical protein
MSTNLDLYHRSVVFMRHGDDFWTEMRVQCYRLMGILSVTFDHCTVTVDTLPILIRWISELQIKLIIENSPTMLSLVSHFHGTHLCVRVEEHAVIPLFNAERIQELEIENGIITDEFTVCINRATNLNDLHVIGSTINDVSMLVNTMPLSLSGLRLIRIVGITEPLLLRVRRILCRESILQYVRIDSEFERLTYEFDVLNEKFQSDWYRQIVLVSTSQRFPVELVQLLFQRYLTVFNYHLDSDTESEFEEEEEEEQA